MERMPAYSGGAFDSMPVITAHGALLPAMLHRKMRRLSASFRRGPVKAPGSALCFGPNDCTERAVFDLLAQIELHPARGMGMEGVGRPRAGRADDGLRPNPSADS